MLLSLLLQSALLLGFSASASALAPPDTVLHVSSPDGRLEVSLALIDEVGTPLYRVARDGRPVIRPSRLGFTFRNAPPLLDGLEVQEVGRRSFDQTWTQPWGETAEVLNHYNELRVTLAEAQPPGRQLDIVFRVFDDGVGFRYELPDQAALAEFEMMDEITEFALAGNHTAWWIPAYRRDRYEILYSSSPVSLVDTVHTPLTMKTADGLYLSIHEADLTDYAAMSLIGSDDLVLRADLAPWGDGVRVRGATPFVTPWRTITIVERAGDLIESNLTLNLNEPNALGDVSWVRPMKYVGIWWGMHIGRYTWGSGPRHGATTANAKRYIEFAAEHGFNGVLIEGWNVGWDGEWSANGELFQFTTPYPDFDIEEVARYAAERGVEIIGHHETAMGIDNYERQLEDAFAYYERLGIHAVKTGYVGWRTRKGHAHHGQYMVRHWRRVLDAAARHHISLDVHEPIKGTGIQRTYPNMLTREGARGQEYNAWSGDGGNPPEHETILPFTRLLAGPMDFTPGIFDLVLDEQPRNRVNTTLAKQLALYVVIYSPLQMAADLRENYTGEPAFRFIVDVPVDWAETRVLNGEIGDYVTVVRRERGGDDWYLGAVTDEEERTLEVELSFLEPGRTYVAEIYADAPDADWARNPRALEISEARVNSESLFELRLVPGGGQAIRFRPATEEELRR